MDPQLDIDKSIPQAGRLSDRISEGALKASSFLAVFLVLLTVQQVFARYFFGNSSVALQELEWHCFSAIFLLSMAGALRYNEHVRVDIFYARFSKRIQAWIDIVGIVLLVIPTALVLVYYGVIFVRQALDFQNLRPDDYYTSMLLEPGSPAYTFFRSIEGSIRRLILAGETSPDPGGLEGRWIVKSLIPLGALILLTQALATTLEKIRLLRTSFSPKG